MVVTLRYIRQSCLNSILVSNPDQSDPVKWNSFHTIEILYNLQMESDDWCETHTLMRRSDRCEHHTNLYTNIEFFS